MTLLLTRIQERCHEDHDDQPERKPLGDLEPDVPLGVQELDEEL